MTDSVALPLSTSTPSHVPASLDPSHNPVILELFSQLNALATRLKAHTLHDSEKGADTGAAEHEVLKLLQGKGPATVPQIARERITSRQNIQVLVDRLAAQKKVEFTPNPGHKRSALVKLTAKGEAWLKQCEPAHRQFLCEIGSRLSDEEARCTLVTLRKLHDLLLPTPARRRTGLKSLDKPLKTDVSEERSATESEPPVEDFPVNLL